MSYSDSEDEQVGLTSVSLGYAGKKINPDSALQNHIGGSAVWLNGTSPASKFYSCDVCKAEMDLLVQISAPLDNKWYDRVLYVFACANGECRRKDGTIKAVRGIHKSAEVEKRLKSDAEPEISAPSEKLGDSLFGSSSASSNPFANAVPSLTPTKPDQAAKSKQKKKAAPVPSSGRYNCKDIEVEEEYLTHEDTKMPDNVEIDENAEDEAEATASGADPEVEKILSSLNDETIAKFIALIDNNPDQILRYDLPLVPVPYSDDAVSKLMHDPSKIPKGLGGKPRSFELQLVPKLITELESDEMLLDGMEWGTIVVATSKDDVLPELDSNGVGYAEEWVGVQWEREMQKQN